MGKNQRLKCPHCEHIWIYTGKQYPYCCCPHCRYKVNIDKARLLYLRRSKAKGSK